MKFIISKSDVLNYLLIFNIGLFYGIPSKIKINILFLLISLFLFPIIVIKDYSTLSKSKVKYISFTFILFLFIIFIFIIHHDTRMLITFLCCIAAVKMSDLNIIKSLFYSKLISFIFAIIAGGYGHINGTAMHGGILLVLFISYISLKKSHINYKEFLLLIVGYLCLSIYTKSGSEIICIGIFIILELLLLLDFKFIKIFLNSFFIKFCCPLLFFLNILFCQCYGTFSFPGILNHIPFKYKKIIYNFLYKSDIFTSGRLSLGKTSLNYFGYKWIGNTLNYTNLSLNGHYFNTDSGMLQLLQSQGIIITIILMIMMIIITYYYIKVENYQFLINIFIIILWAVNEDILLTVSTNFMMIFSFKSIINYKSKREIIYERKTNPLLLVWRKSSS